MNILGKTTYRREALREQGPRLTNCWSAVCHVYGKSTWIDLPRAFIGDMPRVFFRSDQWKLFYIDRSQAEYGDVLFVGARDGERLISHAALIVDVDKIFHCSSKAGTAVIQTDEEFFSHYEQRFNLMQMVSYVDPRNRDLA